MKLGEVSPVFNTAHGFHLAKVTDRKTGLTKSYEDVKSIIKEELILLAQDKKLREYVEELKSSADIKYTETNNEPHEND